MFDVSIYNVIKKGFCKSAKESFPIGNGDLGANVWVNEKGDLQILLSKTDAISEAARLLKIGLLHITFDRALFSENNPPEALLDLRDGSVTITDQEKTVSLKVAAFRNHPLYGVRLKASEPVTMKGEVVIWRDKERILSNTDKSSGFMEAPFPVVESADVLEDDFTWYHHNAWSYTDYTKRNQHLSYIKDYIKDRTFGASFAIAEGDVQSTMYICAGCEMVSNPQTLTKTLRAGAKEAAAADRFNEYLKENHTYWTEYFQKFYIHAFGTQDAEDVSRLYTHQKYMSGCVNQGKLPIKFNGSIFSVTGDPSLSLDFDWRLWGGDYWIQNTRLIYWNMIYCGDFAGVRILFEFCKERIPVFQAQARALYGHDGILMPETLNIHGTYRDCDYGYGKEYHVPDRPRNRYVGIHFNGMLEISWMMLIYLEYTNDREYFEQVCLPFIQESLTFFREHFPMKDGKLYIENASALETWHDCINNCPDVAGLMVVTERLEQLGYPTIIDRNIIPEIPQEVRNNKIVIAPCEIYVETEKKNIENPELYPVFPYYLYHMTEGIPQIVQDTYDERYHVYNMGWQQNLIQAALLGRTEKCKEELPVNFRKKEKGYFFDAYFGPNFDWTPDQCHGCAFSIALRMMLLQDKNGNVIKYPAWPKEWKVEYCLPATGGVVVKE